QGRDGERAGARDRDRSLHRRLEDRRRASARHRGPGPARERRRHGRSGHRAAAGAFHGCPGDRAGPARRCRRGRRGRRGQRTAPAGGAAGADRDPGAPPGIQGPAAGEGARVAPRDAPRLPGVSRPRPPGDDVLARPRRTLLVRRRGPRPMMPSPPGDTRLPPAPAPPGAAARPEPAFPAPVPRIESIAVREIRLALKEPVRISSGVQSHRRIVLVRLAGEGAEAWGECVAGEHPNYSPENADTAWLAIREWLAPRLLGRRFAGPGEVWPAFDRNVRGHHMAKAALEMAAWELAARAAGRPPAQPPRGGARRIPVGVSLGIQESPAALVARAREARDRGYQKIKLNN